MTARIFVFIPALLDPRLEATILEATATAGGAVRFGVALQDNDEQRIEAIKRLPRTDVLVQSPESAIGCAHACNTALTLYDGEPWVMRLDAHMYGFAEWWDDKLLRQADLLGAPRPVISHRPRFGPETGRLPAPTPEDVALGLCLGQPDPNGNHTWWSLPTHIPAPDGKPVVARRVSGGMTLMPGDVTEWLRWPMWSHCGGSHNEAWLTHELWRRHYTMAHPVGHVMYHVSHSKRPNDGNLWVYRRKWWGEFLSWKLEAERYFGWENTAGFRRWAGGSQDGRFMDDVEWRKTFPC